MTWLALKMLTGDRAKYLGLIFAIAFCTFLLENQTSIFAGILRRTGSQILDVTDANIWVMDPKTEYFDQTKALKDTDVNRVRGVEGVQGGGDGGGGGAARGTGQGLAIARATIVNKHDGELAYETVTGKGTTFIIRLPVCPPPAGPAEPAT